MLRMKITIRGVRNKGLWPILMCDLTLICLRNPESNMRLFFFPSNIKAKYYPFFLFGFFTLLSNFNIDFEILCGIVFGFLYNYYLNRKIKISNAFALKVENSFLCKWMRNKKGFLRISNTGIPDIPINLANVTNTPPPQDFSSFKGKGVTVGTSDINTTNENIDYSNLSKSQEEITSSESRLELNTSTNTNSSQ